VRFFDPAPAVAALQSAAGTAPISARLRAPSPQPTEKMSWSPGRAARVPRRVIRPWLAPAPSQVTISCRRKAGGSAVIAVSSTARWSAAALLPAEPGRSFLASGSAVLPQ
jgi:hypothetical protein